MEVCGGIDMDCASLGYRVHAADQADDLEELISHWAKREEALFGPLGTRMPSPSGETRRFSNWQFNYLRGGSTIQMLRHLISRHDHANGLQASLALLDALWSQKVGQTGESVAAHIVSTMGLPTLLGAAARVALKCGGVAAFSDGDTLTDMEIAERFQCFKQEPPEPGAVANAEALIVSGLNGRTTLSSISEWARTVSERLNALKALRDENALVGLQTKVLPKINSWAGLITEKVVASPALPPRALALGACAMGLAASGLIDSSEIRPKHVGDAAWKATLFSRISSGGGRKGGPAIGASLLAEAACCSLEELQLAVFCAIEALRSSLDTAQEYEDDGDDETATPTSSPGRYSSDSEESSGDGRMA